MVGTSFMIGWCLWSTSCHRDNWSKYESMHVYSQPVVLSRQNVHVFVTTGQNMSQCMYIVDQLSIRQRSTPLFWMGNHTLAHFFTFLLDGGNQLQIGWCLWSTSCHCDNWSKYESMHVHSQQVVLSRWNGHVFVTTGQNMSQCMYIVDQLSMRQRSTPPFWMGNHTLAHFFTFLLDFGKQL